MKPIPKEPLRVQLRDRIWETEVDASFADDPNAFVEALQLLLQGPELTEEQIINGEARRKFQTEELKLREISKEQEQEMIEDLIIRGFCRYTVVLANKYPIVFKSFSAGDAANGAVIAPTVSIPDDPRRITSQWYLDNDTISILAMGIESFNGHELSGTRDEREAYIRGKSNFVVGFLSVEWNKFSKKVAKLLTSQVIGDMLVKS
jgi:hypothetical protein